MPSNWTEDERVEHLFKEDMIGFHEAFSDAAFILPLVHPSRDSQRYLSGHPTSSVAYGAHFKLGVVAHSRFIDEYEHDLKPLKKYGHNGTEAGVQEAVRRAVEEFSLSKSNPASSRRF